MKFVPLNYVAIFIHGSGIMCIIMLSNILSGVFYFTEISTRPNMTVKAVILDPEIVFVANLTNADAPALKVSFQCDFSLTSGKLAQRMTAQVKGFKVLACAFLKPKQDNSVTTVRKNVVTLKCSILWMQHPFVLLWE